MKNPYHVLMKPLVTEKTMQAIERRGAYTFAVRPDATKPEIRLAVERIFSVKVDRVRTLRRKGKPKSRRVARFSRTRQPEWKRAIVTLKEGHRIQIL
jgi:large subunit ribosomal protein L23